MSKEIKSKPAEEVFFVMKDEGWTIYSKKYSGYILSKGNTWTTESDRIKIFNLLHNAINLAKRRGFKFDIPDYTYEIVNDEMHIYSNNREIKVVEQIKSDKQAHDKMKELFHIQPSKMEML